MKKVLLFAAFVFALALFVPARAEASEGQFVLTNKVGEQSTCWFGSVLMGDQEYQILYSCRNLSYPGGTEVFSYVVWANILDSDKPLKLGTLGLGKGQFASKDSFSSLYVTKEINSKVRTPSGPVVMQGGLQPLSPLLEGGSSDVIVTEPDLIPAETPQPTAAPSRGSNVFRLGGIVAFIILFVVILMVILITRR